jgi:hypothetical protein
MMFLTAVMGMTCCWVAAVMIVYRVLRAATGLTATLAMMRPLVVWAMMSLLAAMVMTY